MKQRVIAQYGMGENCYVRDFVLELADDQDEDDLDEDELERLADEAGAEWRYHDSYDAIMATDHDVLSEGLAKDGLPVARYTTFARSVVDAETEHQNSQGVQQ